MKRDQLTRLCIAALLCAIGIIIPMFSPVKIILPPASFTLGSHVAVMIAMFISPGVAGAVALGTALGFLLGGFPLVIVMRALSHIIFACLGAQILKKKPDILKNPVTAIAFAFGISLVHALCEVVVSTIFFFSDGQAILNSNVFFNSVLMLVGIGTVVHSMIDFAISMVIWKPLQVGNFLKVTSGKTELSK